jgi:hypothetical protein
MVILFEFGFGVATIMKPEIRIKNKKHPISSCC